MILNKRIYKLGWMVALAATLTSCSDFLNVEPLNEIVLEKFWNEESDVENVISGCYSTLQSQACIERMMAWGEFRSDNIVGGTNVQNNQDLANIFKENINASNSFTSWDKMYYVINTCNTILHYAPTVAQKDPNYTESELNATRAEVSALRDLCYFYLIRTFRDVPYTTTPYLDNTQQSAVPATPFDMVLDSLIFDLGSVRPYVVKNYPTNKVYYQHGRITQDAINAILCDMYLWKQNYQMAVQYADLVIQAKTEERKKEIEKNSSTGNLEEQLLNGYPLISDQSGNRYGNAFTAIFGNGNSSESIFELMFMNDNNMLSDGAVSYYYGNATTFPGIVKPAEFISTDMTLDVPQLFSSKFDTRYYENIESFGGNTFGIAKYSTTSGSVTTSGVSPSGSHGNFYPSEYCHANWIIYRLTDVMLMKAEALVEMVDEKDSTSAGIATRDTLLHQAYDIVNTINLRSNGATNKENIDYNLYSSKTQMANLVLQERQRELMFEGKRWYDLVRRSRRDGNTNYLISRVTQKGSENASVLQSKLTRMDAIYWPYNKEEIQVNSNLVQNPAFDNGNNNSYEGTSK
ncbi:MAG: RagB/SusD family nutrient uptake outer membrane protein [Bacteroidota bacterium]|nr:RagB/SusD family nutrient uptake outer membrane protein [Bacteroidota bacterium]